MAQSRLREQTRMLGTMLASALPANPSPSAPGSLPAAPRVPPGARVARGLGWHRGWWPGSGEVSGWGTSLGDLGLPRGPCPRVPSRVHPAQSPASQPAHARFPWQSRAPRIRLIIELIKNKSFTPGEVARQSSVLVLATGKHIHSHLLINKAISMP